MVHRSKAVAYTRLSWDSSLEQPSTASQALKSRYLPQTTHHAFACRYFSSPGVAAPPLSHAKMRSWRSLSLARGSWMGANQKDDSAPAVLSTVVFSLDFSCCSFSSSALWQSLTIQLPRSNAGLRHHAQVLPSVVVLDIGSRSARCLAHTGRLAARQRGRIQQCRPYHDSLEPYGWRFERPMAECCCVELRHPPRLEHQRFNCWYIPMDHHCRR